MTYIAIWCLSATKASHVGPRWRSDDQDDLRRNRRLSLLAMCTSTWNQRTLTEILPIEILERKRKAFPARALSLFLVEHRNEIDALFRGSRLDAMGYIDEAKFRIALYRSDFDQTRPLMKMIGLELWLRNDLVSSLDTVPEPQSIRMKRTAREIRFMRKFKTT